MEIGGYLEFPRFVGKMLHENAIALNSARNGLAYLIEAKKIREIALPKFLCASVGEICNKYGVQVHYYTIGKDFLPDGLNLENGECLYLVNYYGQIDNQKIEEIKKSHDKLIVDNVQAYFQMPVQNTDTIYTCRKFFGVPDGAFLYTDIPISRTLEQDRSAKRMTHLLGRFEESGSEYYAAYAENESIFESLPLRTMSKITENLLRGIDYQGAKAVRERNFIFLDKVFSSLNKLSLKIPEGAFMYPLYVPDGVKMRKELQNRKIYIPTLWPDVFDLCAETEWEYDMARNILPLPCDQRYNMDAMEFLVKEVLNCLQRESV